jgi:hypothetical protein
MLIVKRPGAGLLFFGASLPRPASNPLMRCDELLLIRTFPGDFIPTTAANLAN